MIHDQSYSLLTSLDPREGNTNSFTLSRAARMSFRQRIRGSTNSCQTVGSQNIQSTVWLKENPAKPKPIELHAGPPAKGLPLAIHTDGVPLRVTDSLSSSQAVTTSSNVPAVSGGQLAVPPSGLVGVKNDQL
jgi:hypothetical protein